MQGVLLSAGLMSALTLFTNLLGFVRELLFARAFGASHDADSFVTAFSIVATCFLFLAGGSLQGAFMPRYQQAIVRDEKVLAKGLWHATFKAVFVIAGITGLVIYFGAEKIVYWVVPGFDQESQAMTAQILRWLAPLVILNSLGSLFQSILHAHRIFVLPALVPIGNNLALIFSIFFLVPVYGLAAMSYGSVIGGVLWLLLIPCVFKQLPSGAGRLNARNLIDLSRAICPLIVLLAVDQFSGLIQKTLVSDQEVGSIAVLSYAARLEGLPVGIFAGALAAVIFPALVEVASRGDKKALEDKFRFGIAVISFFLLPSATFLIVESELVVRVLLERGSFTSEAAVRTARALEWYSVGLLSQGLIVYLNRVYFALNDTRTPMVIGIISAAVHVLFCWVAVDFFGYLGIAMGTSLYAFIYSAILVWRLNTWITNPFRLLVISVWRYFIAVFAILTIEFFIDFPVSMAGLLCAVVSFVGIYAVLVLILGDPVMGYLKSRMMGPKL